LRIDRNAFKGLFQRKSFGSTTASFKEIQKERALKAFFKENHFLP
jgi:hypothetical protein